MSFPGIITTEVEKFLSRVEDDAAEAILWFRLFFARKIIDFEGK